MKLSAVDIERLHSSPSGARVWAAALYREAGDVARAELIEVQCALLSTPDDLPLRRKARAILGAHRTEWLAELGLGEDEGFFVGGFVERVTLCPAGATETAS